MLVSPMQAPLWSIRHHGASRFTETVGEPDENGTMAEFHLFEFESASSRRFDQPLESYR